MTDRRDFERGLGRLARHPGTASTMNAFGALHEAALGDGALTRKAKELMAISISIVQQCDGCIAWHVHGALQAGASSEEVGEAVSVAVLMGGGPATYYASKALAALEAAEPPVEA